MNIIIIGTMINISRRKLFGFQMTLFSCTMNKYI